MDSERFDRFARKLSSRRGMVSGMAALLGLASHASGVTARPTRCKPSQKRCGRRCIPKRACCPRTEKRCRNRCIPKRRCCTNADCGAFKLCADGKCIVGQGTCTTSDNYCTRTGNFNCDTGDSQCACFRNSLNEPRCGSTQFLPREVECLNDVECAKEFPNVPGVFCMQGGAGENCFVGSRCHGPCLG